jgi:hypothetical protein
MTHPTSCTDPTCDLAYVDHLRDINVSPAATPSRAVTRNDGQPDEPTTVTRARERRLEADLPAYRRMRDAGIQPRATRGAAAAERRLGG